MKFVAFLSASLGVVVGLLFGLLLRESAPEATATPASAARVDAQVLAELRELRALLERQALLPRAGDTPGAAAEPQPLAAPALTLAEVQAVVDAALAELRAAAASAGDGLSDVVVDPRADEAVEEAWAALGGSDGSISREAPKLYLATPREIYQRFGKPDFVNAHTNGMRWTYWAGPRTDPSKLGKHGQLSGLAVVFTDGYLTEQTTMR
jgi:hypothetical protein